MRLAGETFLLREILLIFYAKKKTAMFQVFYFGILHAFLVDRTSVYAYLDTAKP